MATIVLEYDGRNKEAGSMLRNLLMTGLFKNLTKKTNIPNYDKEFVKTILDADNGHKTEFTQELENKYFRDL